MSKTITISDELHDFIRGTFDSETSFDIAIKTLLHMPTIDGDFSITTSARTVNFLMPAYLYNYLILTRLSSKKPCSHSELTDAVTRYIEDHELLNYHPDDKQIINHNEAWHIRLAISLKQLVKKQLVTKDIQKTTRNQTTASYTITTAGLGAIEEIGLMSETNKISPNGYDIYLAWVDENRQSRGALSLLELAVSPLTDESQHSIYNSVTHKPEKNNPRTTAQSASDDIVVDDPNELARRELLKFRQISGPDEFSISVVADDAIHHYRIVGGKAIPMEDPSEVEQGNSQV